jgi:hypothetical protein
MILKIPIELSDKQIEEYQMIYKKTFGKDISRDEAIEQGLSLIRLVAIVINESWKYI